ncbi:lipopolysaccharide assembly protein LapB [Maridesulfovibrio ferrireducens]|uniref:tetratricopeptide repeat protein n=1 Tax=Maridesulfovibrio ferrireducens TaxID=246191 RepID=UPI001A211F96|nr:tetratricopeptide repeat protein [Maridesulfovibrio ferrireducens]MBI9112141.1 hypothetical protein [Maridesulfovibrio ferrireducens]
MSTGQRTKLHGVFSTLTESKVGAGATTKQTFQKTYWFVEELKNEIVEVQPLNSHDVPSGPKNTVAKEEFLDNFEPEPEYYVEVVLPRIRNLDATIKRGEKHRDRSENYSAEYEFNSAIAVDEDNVRANFGLGLTYLDRGETGRADDIFRRLVVLEAIFEPRHKHLFNEFGISLRKNCMIDQALEYYHKAESICKRDENLYLNIARAYFENGEVEDCLKYVNKSLDINSDHEEAGLFLEYMREIGYGGDRVADSECVAPQKIKNKKSPAPDFNFNI